MSESLRATALALAVQAYQTSTTVQQAQDFYAFLNAESEASNQPEKDVGSSKTKATRVPKQSSSPTPGSGVNAAPAQNQEAQVAPATSATASSVIPSSTTGTLAASQTAATAPQPLQAPAGQTAEAYQAEISALTLATAKIDVERVRSLLRIFKAERFGQVVTKDYPEYYAKLKVLAAAIAEEQKAKASSPESLV